MAIKKCFLVPTETFASRLCHRLHPRWNITQLVLRDATRGINWVEDTGGGSVFFLADAIILKIKLFLFLKVHRRKLNK